MERRGGRRIFYTPGKMMIAGEYSVLAPNGEALALAVDPGLEVVATPSPAWEIVRAEIASRWSQGHPVPEELLFAQAAWASVREAEGRCASPHRLLTRTLGPIGMGGGKPGLGGSASAVVGIMAALFGLDGRDPELCRQRLLDLALETHRRIQGGRGSGYDVATVVHGGLVLWRPGRREAQHLRWPEGLYFLLGYSGESASTSRRLVHLEGVAGNSGEDFHRDMDPLARKVCELTRAFLRGDLPAILDGVRTCRRELARWDERRGLKIHTPRILRMMELAEALGAAAKISGAGGGDSVLAVARDKETLDEVSESWRFEGFEPLQITSSPKGTREEPLEDELRDGISHTC